ncbi:unnamed protein product [Musa acuminata subsp. malaccensis]|uniref:(wild Malaysian banana) hypothetical protein n=1 Tax=Musa acuminata subsp. malaccensis TaxID=214687 RepID=A0A804KTP4_MUSAM|nr:unnamed protein product [Musa acuminata subsp. malaccensis]
MKPLRNVTALVAGRRVKLHFSQRRWSLAEGKSEASRFSTTGSDTMIEIIEDKNNN